MPMKRVIGGKTYNTDTSVLVARYGYEDEKDREVWVNVYQNRGGAFFEVHSREELDINGENIRRNSFEATSREELEKLVAGEYVVNDIELFDERALATPPKAEVEEAPSTTIYLRLPPSLKNRIETQAKEAGLSVNAWMIRCAEHCARPQVVREA